jgi:hypothetical protein
MICFLYLMERTGRVKIGIAEDPDDRANTLSLAAGERIVVVHRVEYSNREAARLAEVTAHRRFDAHRLLGEWFTDVPEIRAYVAALLPGNDESAASILASVVDPKTCPRCGHTGPTGADFGWRDMGDGTMRSQSYCRSCRSKTRAPNLLFKVRS